MELTMPSSKKTTGFQLDQWQAGDRFSMGDLNGDLKKIDDAMVDVKTSATNASAVANRVNEEYKAAQKAVEQRVDAKFDKVKKEIDESVHGTVQSLTQFTNQLDSTVKDHGVRLSGVEGAIAKVQTFDPNQYLTKADAAFDYVRVGDAVFSVATEQDLVTLTNLLNSSGKKVEGSVAVVGGSKFWVHNGTSWNPASVESVTVKKINFAGRFIANSLVTLRRSGSVVCLDGRIDGGQVFTPGTTENIAYADRNVYNVKYRGDLYIPATSYIDQGTPRFVSDATVVWRASGNIDVTVARNTSYVFVNTTFVDA